MASKITAVVGLSLVIGVLSLGGWQNVPTNDSWLLELTKFALGKLDVKSNNRFWSRLVEVRSAQRQVVNGLNWKITFSHKQTECSKDSVPWDLSACSFNDNADEEICTVTLYQAPAYNGKPPKQPEIKSSICNHPKSKPLGYRPTRVGGAMPIADLNDETVQTAAQKAVSHINGASNSMYLMSFIEIESGKSQIIRGVRYILKIAMGTSSCLKSQMPDEFFVTNERCPLQDEARRELCTVTIDVRLWENSYEVQDFRCNAAGSENARAKRSADMNVVHMEQPILGGNDGHDIHYGIFQNFKFKFNKIYKSEEEETRRFAIFRDNMIKARKMQAMELGTARYGATKFADLTEEEFRKNYLSPVWKAGPTMKQAKTPNIKAPDSFDWRDHNAVSEVKNQGSCGSCWAFSTTGNIEGQWALKKKELVSLSEQELVDCDKVDEGCNGGLPSQAYKEIIRLGGLEGESDYPYKGRGEKCSFDKSKVKVYINDSVTISTNETEMASWLAANGPISIGINANAMQFYMGGISHPWKIFCEPGNLDHGVLIVGYGTKNGEPYWIVKNSWGAGWGEKGYYLVYRGAGVCGLNRMPTSAVIH